MQRRHPVPVLFAIPAVVLLVSPSPGSAQAQKAAPGRSPGAALSPEARQLLALLPEDNAVPGWRRGADVRSFGPEHLFEHIDGAAEGYLSFGFRQVVTAKYTHPQKSEAVIDIYQMKDARGAFGIYGSELNPKAEFRPIGAEGYAGRTTLNFWAGSYYVKVRVLQESRETKHAMVALAERCSRKLGDPGSAPPETRLFPRENQIEHSIRLVPRDVLGHTFFPEGFEARYQFGDAEIDLVIVSLANAASATEALAKYRKSIASGGKVERDLKTPGAGGFIGRDDFYGSVVAVRTDNRVFIALGGSSSDTGLSVVGAALQNRGK